MKKAREPASFFHRAVEPRREVAALLFILVVTKAGQLVDIRVADLPRGHTVSHERSRLGRVHPLALRTIVVLRVQTQSPISQRQRAARLLC